MTTSLNGSAATRLNFPVSLTSDTLSSFMDTLVTYSDGPGWSAQREGFIMRRTLENDPEYPDNLIIVTKDEGYISFVPLASIQIHAIHEGHPLSIHAQVSLLAFEKRNLVIRSRSLATEVNRVQQELSQVEEKWDARIVKACEEADRKGYCSEFEAIAEAAGFDVPEMEEFEVSCTVTITVTISKEARSLGKAKELVDFEDISSAISGEDSIDDWSVD